MSNDQLLLIKLAKCVRILHFYALTIEERFAIEDIVSKLKKQLKNR